MEIGSDAHWIVRGRLLTSRAPRGEEELRSMAQAGVTHVLSLVDNPEEATWSRQAGVEFHQARMGEMGSPAPREVERALRFVLKVLRVPENCLLLHCQAGVGRAGVVAAAFLGASAGLTPEEAIDAVRARRPGSVGSQDKEVAVEAFLGAFVRGEVVLEGARSCPRCEAKVLAPQELCFRCSGARDLEAFLGAEN